MDSAIYVGESDAASQIIYCATPDSLLQDSLTEGKTTDSVALTQTEPAVSGLSGSEEAWR